MDQLLEACIALARQAGVAIMEIYASGDFETEIKNEDNFISPLTKADKVSNGIIVSGLKRLSDFPVISEEGAHVAGNSTTFWLVDPIDGTKEFIKRNGEFTVNIGLVKNRKPILGVVYAPSKDVLYYGTNEGNAFKQENGKEPTRISAEYGNEIPTVIVSRSHQSEAAEKFLTKLGKHRTMSMGSSLKLCLVAEGKAIVYPRFTPTSLWDTAAAEAVVRAAGGSVTDFHGKDLPYDPARNMLNPFFIVAAKGKNYLDLLPSSPAS
jgi:3'(2'), 5'-bisphosphate nucleotidase